MLMKMLFFDLRDTEAVDGFVRRLEPARKHPGNPILVSDRSLEENNMSLYGTVLRHPANGHWQMWYTTKNERLGGTVVAYAESDDGLRWERPAHRAVELDGAPTNVVLAGEAHGIAVLCDEAESRSGWRYKMLAGAPPSGNICAFRSADGIHWVAVAEHPVIPSNPDCPMSLHRAHDGRYVVYTRPEGGDRRVARAESWDFIRWSEVKLVLEPGPEDPVQTQFYGMGSTPYGGYELGTLWVYHTAPEDHGYYKVNGGRQEPELAYCRNGSSWGWPTLAGAGGYAWHRMAPREPFIALGGEGTWDWGRVQPASQMVFLEDEIRIYYAGSFSPHGVRDWVRPEPRCGIGFASLQPDRFVSLVAQASPCHLLTRPLRTDTPEFYANADVAPGGHLRVEVTDIEGQPIAGFEGSRCAPVTGDSVRHRVRWQGDPATAALSGPWIRLRVTATQARVYALSCGPGGEVDRYWKFRIPHTRATPWERLPAIEAAAAP